MSLDAITINGLCRELARQLADCRVDKIHMPRREETVLHLRSQQGSFRLTISCSGAGGRVYLTDEKTENPEAPPMFCMLLRKHLTAARLLEISQPEYERMLRFRFSAYDEFGEISEKSLIVELTGRRNNLILLGADDAILGCLKKVDAEMSPQRPILPGLKYRMPPGRDRQPLAQLEEESALFAANQIADMEQAAKELGDRFDLVSPIVGRELAARAKGDRAALARQLLLLAERVRQGDYQPTMICQDGAYRDFTFMPMEQFGPAAECRRMDSFSQLIREFYAEKTGEERKKTASAALVRLMSAAEARLTKKLANQANDLQKARKREDLKRKADLIMANIHAIPPGAESVAVTDYFSPGLEQVVLELDGEKTAQQNAQALFKEYTRMKNAEAALTDQIAQGKQELEYVETVLLSLLEAQTMQDVSAIREELLEGGYLRNREKGRRKKAPAFRPREYVSPGGMRILCGRNNRENDWLTLKTAAKNDLWFHAHQAPGSHVILFTEGRQPGAEDLEYAASIAAGHSKMAGQSLAAIDYALARHVKKPSGAKPGMVIYTDYKTLFVQPLTGDEEK